jgi:hypothetical protein
VRNGPGGSGGSVSVWPLWPQAALQSAKSLSLSKKAKCKDRRVITNHHFQLLIKLI